MKNLLLILLTLSAFNTYSALKCDFTTKNSKSKISWTAFKTPKKVGVGGAFDKASVTGMPSKKLEDFLSSLQFSIHADSVNTNNKARDAKIYRYFFSKMSAGDYIRGFVTKVDKKNAQEGVITFQLWFNGKQKEEKLTYKFDSKSRKLVAKGKIDVLDYKMSKSLKAITKACYAKHEGVTWPDVEIALETQLSPCFSF